MELSIVSTAGQKKFDIQWIECNTPTGNLVIQPGHVPMIVSLLERQPIVFCFMSGAQETITPAHAIMHVLRTSVLLLINE